MKSLSRYAKAVAGALGALQVWGLTVTLEDSAGGASIVAGEWFGLCAVGIALVAVFAVPNTPPEGEPSDPNMSEQAQPTEVPLRARP